MRRWVKITIPSVLLAAAVILCAVRWQAWFVMPEEPQWTGDTIEYAFPAPITNNQSPITNPQSPITNHQSPIINHQLPITFLVLGDIHSNLSREDYNLLAQRVPNADAVIQTGDWLERGQFYYQQQLFREWTNSDLNGLPVIVCPGNHEYSKGLGSTLSPVWQETFQNPKSSISNLQSSIDSLPFERGAGGVSTNPPSPSIDGVHYYVDFPSLRLIVIDTNPIDRIVEMTRLLTWVRQAMYEAGDRFVVVLMHHPVISAAKGRFNPAVYGTFRLALSKADLVISGHDHLYMRKGPFVVMNTAGPAKQPRTKLTADVKYALPVYGVLTIDQSPITNHQSSMEFRVYRLDNGEILDSLHVSHD